MSLVKVKLRKVWLGRPRGAVIEVDPLRAELLRRDGTAARNRDRSSAGDRKPKKPAREI